MNTALPVRVALTAALLVLIVSAIGLDSAAGRLRSEPPMPKAVTAGTVSVNDLAKLHVVGGNGNLVTEEGRAYGSLPGSARATLDVTPTTATATFTFHLSGGSISGHGSGKLHTGSGRYESFGGVARITSGTGRYEHISGSGGFYGVLNRRNWNAEVQVIGKLHI